MNKTMLTLGLACGLVALSLGCGKSGTTASAVQDTESTPWQKLTLNSTTGVAIEMDYQFTHYYDGDSYSYALSPLWFNVTSSSGLTDADQIRIVVTPWNPDTAKDGSSTLPPYPGMTAQTIDLTNAGDGRFTGQLPDPFLTAEGNESGGFNVAPKISVVVDGQWQVDSYDGKTDFLPTFPAISI